MAISNSSRGLSPGICTSTSRPTNPYEGFLIYETDTNRVLIWDNSAWVMIADTDTPPAMSLVSSVNFSSSTNVVLDNVFNSSFKNYKIIIGVRPTSTNTGDCVFQLRAGGANISAVNYVWQGVNQNSSNSPTANNGAQSGGWYLTNFYSATDSSSTTELTLFSPNESAFTGYQATTSFDWPGPTFYSRTMHGFYPATTVADGFRLVPNISSNGYVRVYGYRD